VVWAIFSVVVALAQAVLHAAAMLSSAMAATSPLLAGGLLAAAGVFQWTPLKRACLAACRSPLSFLMAGWREGRIGAFVMGLRHGLYCLGCCWVLMALLFVVGVMNLLWVAAIAVAILVEKVVPRGDLVGRLAGVVLVAAS
jgi:predicted metal-binding membrane protein